MQFFSIFWIYGRIPRWQWWVFQIGLPLRGNLGHHNFIVVFAGMR